MKIHLLVPLLFIAVVSGSLQLAAEEAKAAVYVVDRSPKFEEMGGACLPYTPEEATGAAREILALAKGPPGSTLLMIAFDGDSPHLGLAPVVAEQGEETSATRFPAEGSVWPFESPQRAVDLYIAVFDRGDPQLERIAEYAEWLADALGETNEVDALLHAEAIQKRLSNLLRLRSAGDYRVKYGDLASLRIPPTSKAAVTRGTSTSEDGLGKREPKTAIAGVRRGLKNLDDEWSEDGRPIPFGLAMPGILVFSISTPSAP